mgnify:CR=1 FL=1
MLTAIVAAAWNGENGYVIGKDGALPWRLPKDLKMFRDETMGKTIIMGRKTWETLPRTLDGRNIVVFTSKDIPEVTTIQFPEQAPDEAIVCGGSQTYDAFLPFTDKIIFTEIMQFIQGETLFPLSKDQLARTFRISHSWPVVTEQGVSWKRSIYERK